MFVRSVDLKYLLIECEDYQYITSHSMGMLPVEAAWIALKRVFKPLFVKKLKSKWAFVAFLLMTSMNHLPLQMMP